MFFLLVAGWLRPVSLASCVHLRRLTVRWFVQPRAYLQINPSWARTPEIVDLGPLLHLGGLETFILQVELGSASLEDEELWFENLRPQMAYCEDAFIRLLEESNVERILIGPTKSSEWSLLVEEKRGVLTKMFPRLHQSGLLRIFCGDEAEWMQLNGEHLKCMSQYLRFTY